MTFWKFASCNIKRSPARWVLVSLSIIISTATLCVVLSLEKGYTSAVKDELVNNTGVHMYITKEGCPIEAASVIAQGGLSPLYVDEEVFSKVQSLPEVDAVLPFKLFTTTTDDGSRTDIFMGVTPAVVEIKNKWAYTSGGWFESDSSVILGAEMAKIENLQIGEKMYSENLDCEFTVSGILARNYTQDDGTFFIPLKRAQKLVHREGKLSAIAIKLKNIEQLDDTRNKIRSMVPKDYFVIGSDELSEGILAFFASTRISMMIMVIVTFVISIFGIINTTLMSIIERKKEIAYLKCIGAGRKDLLKLISLETLTMSTIGSFVGILLGAIISPLAGDFMLQFFIAYMPSSPISTTTLPIIATVFSVCTLVGLICVIYPALKASRIVPMEVLRNE